MYQKTFVTISLIIYCLLPLLVTQAISYFFKFSKYNDVSCTL
uniref:Uncharacterized protein n=1 Tax=Meloidogyne enterolobii TaxID=390850 RepID=A0A6V7UZ25_MELEN|nr:unnamed protein product [Meloidogyne enterolobii]